MGQIGFARRISASLQALFAHGEKRWLDEVDEARKGTLTLSTMVRHAYEAMDETAGVLRDLFDWGGSPVLPNVFIQAPAVDLPLGQSEFAWLPEPVLFDPKHPNDTFIDVTKPVLLGGAPKDVLDAVVERIRSAGPDGRLEGVEDQLLGRRAHRVDRDLPAGVVQDRKSVV